MTKDKELEELRAENARLTDENHRLVSRNLALSEQLDVWHDTRMRVQLLKELLLNDRHNTPHHTPEDYIDFRRVISAMELMRQHPNYSVAAISQDAGFTSVRTFQRRMQQATGLTPVEYRLMFEPPAP